MTFIERAMNIMNLAWYIKNYGGPDVFVNYCPHVNGLTVYTYEPRWADGATITHMLHASEERPSELDAIEAHLDTLMESIT